LIEKSRGQKSRATVPLIKFDGTAVSDCVPELEHMKVQHKKKYVEPDLVENKGKWKHYIYYCKLRYFVSTDKKIIPFPLDSCGIRAALR
jgi:hypothetical protein